MQFKLGSYAAKTYGDGIKISVEDRSIIEVARKEWVNDLSEENSENEWSRFVGECAKQHVCSACNCNQSPLVVC